MKKIILFTTLCLGLAACGNNQANKKEKVSTDVTKDVVEVIYFHGKQRCATCMAIEKNTKELIDAQFADAIKNGTLVFKSVDITEDEALADKYEVTWSSLIIVDYDKGQEKAENMTEFSFANARTSPEKFKEGVSAQITKMLND